MTDERDAAVRLRAVQFLAEQRHASAKPPSRVPSSSAVGSAMTSWRRLRTFFQTATLSENQ